MDIPRADRKVAYLSMEIGVDPTIPTYAGGLGILAGDTLRSCADLGVPTVAVSLLSEEGYFRQTIDAEGNQHEAAEFWKKEDHLEKLNEKVVVTISGRDVVVQAWQYTLTGNTGFELPVIFLDTNVAENSEYDRSLTKHLYQGDQAYRIAQEIILGIAGSKILTDLGYNVEKYHLNEGHGSFLILELLSDTQIHHGEDELRKRYNFEAIKEKIVFTTHTPVPAGHDQFDVAFVKEILGNNVSSELIDYCARDGKLNMTQIAIDNSNYINGVAKKHAEVSRKMFPGKSIGAITNGIYSNYWVSEPMRKIFDVHCDDWQLDPASLRLGMLLPDEELWNAHQQAKQELLDIVQAKAQGFDLNTFTIGFARRATPYKRLLLLFQDTAWLKALHGRYRLQLVFAGKAHPSDTAGKELIRKLHDITRDLGIPFVFLENYDMALGKKLVAGVDLWLNTPLKPNEASGTSGMKAALNGVPQLSVLDGWWLEGCLEHVTGWSIGMREGRDEDDARDMYMKLEKAILPTFYEDKYHWIRIMRQSIAINGSYFNTHRMVKEYLLHAYFQ